MIELVLTYRFQSMDVDMRDMLKRAEGGGVADEPRARESEAARGRAPLLEVADLG